MTFATIQVLYDLCSMSDHIQEIRHEAETALDRNGGIWNTDATKGMKHLDSFMKESQRMNLPSLRKSTL